MAVKVPPLLHKMSLTSQRAWYNKNAPDQMPPHLTTSVAKSKSANTAAQREKAKKAEAQGLKAYGATRGTATGGEGGNADAAPRDTIAPLTPEQHAKKDAEARKAAAAAKAAKPVKQKKPKAEPKPAEKKPLTTAQRIALIAAAAKKAQSAAGKAKAAAKFDVPTEDPDDQGHDDYLDQHYGMHHYKEEIEETQMDDISEGKMGELHADLVRQAKGIAFGKRYKEGNMTGAYKAIQALGKKHGMENLADHPEVSSALQRANEEVELEEAAYTGKGNHRPGWMLRADPELKKKVDANIKAAQLRKKYMGKTGEEIAAMRQEEVELDEAKDSPFITFFNTIANRHAEYAKYAKNKKDAATFAGAAERARNAAKMIEAGKSHVEAMAHYDNKKATNEEVEQVDEVNSRHSFTSAQAALTPKSSDVKAAVGTTARDKAKTNKYARRISKITGGEYSKQDVKDNLKSLANEEVEQIDELKNSTLADYIIKAGEERKSAAERGAAEIGKGMHGDPRVIGQAMQRVGKRTLGMVKAGTKLKDKLANEEVEQIEEARVNHRDFATDGVMHPSMANASYMKQGSRADFYSSKTGNKLTNGEVIKNNGKHVHIKHDGDIHKFRVSETAPHQMQSEEVEYIEEKLSASDPASAWIHDFVRSNNPKFSGKTKEERKNMALGAYYAAKRGKGMKEEVEQVEESSHEGSTPTTDSEEELAAHHGDPKKITYGDVVKARIKSARGGNKNGN
jgi:hypothetical protein